MNLQIKGVTRTILMGIGFLFILFLLWYFSTIVTYILISVVLAFIGKPVVRWISLIRYKKFAVSRGIASLITLILLWLVAFSFFRFVIPLVLNELIILSQIDFAQVVNSLGEPVINFMQSLCHQHFTFEEKEFFDIFLESLSAKIDLSKLSGMVGTIAGTIGELIIGLFSVSFITFFFLKDENLFRDVIILLVPTDFETSARHIVESVSLLLRRYFVGLIFEVVMVMILVTAGLSIIGIGFNHAAVIGMICGIFNIVPYLGPWLGSAVGLIFGAALNINNGIMENTLTLMGYMTLVFAIVQLIDNILFQPLIYSSSVKAHPLEIFIVFLAAGSMAGVKGMILAIPSYTIIRVIAKEFFANMKIVKKLTENLDVQNKRKSYIKTKFSKKDSVE